MDRLRRDGVDRADDTLVAHGQQRVRKAEECGRLEDALSCVQLACAQLPAAQLLQLGRVPDGGHRAVARAVEHHGPIVCHDVDVLPLGGEAALATGQVPRPHAVAR